MPPRRLVEQLVQILVVSALPCWCRSVEGVAAVPVAALTSDLVGLGRLLGRAGASVRSEASLSVLFQDKTVESGHVDPRFINFSHRISVSKTAQCVANTL